MDPESWTGRIAGRNFQISLLHHRKAVGVAVTDHRAATVLHDDHTALVGSGDASGEIKMVAIRSRGAGRGVRLVACDSVWDYIRRARDGLTGRAAAGGMSASAAQDQQVS